MNDRTPTYLGPKFGVEAGEDGKYRAAIYRGDTPTSLSDKRLPFGEAFVEAQKMSANYVSN